MSALDDYLVEPKLSLLDKTRIQAQVLVPVLRALRSELGKEKADAIVKQALRGWSKQLFAAIADGVDGSPRRKWAAMHTAMFESTKQDVTVEMLRHDKDALEFDVTRCRFADCECDSGCGTTFFVESLQRKSACGKPAGVRHGSPRTG